jgi:eukaryotic-like serine/threonine-protein kinase
MGLAQRIMLFTGGLVVGLVTVTLVYTTYQAEAGARARLRQSLTEAREIWEAYQADRFAKLKLGVRVLGNDSPFKAAVQTGDPQTVYDLLKERGRDLAADFFIATGPGGNVIARSDSPEEGRADLHAEPIVIRALEGEESASVWRQRGRLYHAVAVPMQFGPEIVGVLVAGYALDESLARELGKLTHSQVAFFAEDGTEPRLIASSFGARESSLRSVGRSVLAREGTQELALADEPHAAISVPLRSEGRTIVGRVLVARSVIEELEDYRRFRNSLILVGLAVMVLALGLAIVVTRRITGPLRQLVALVERARDGSYSGAVAVVSEDEIGHLSQAFNRLLTDLREKDELIGFLRSGNTPTGEAGAGERVAPPEAETLALGALTSITPSTPGTVFAERYEIVETVGQGGMGIVYRVRDRELDEIVALKMLRAHVLREDPSQIDRFKQEIRLARKITHRNVLRSFDFAVYSGTPYLTMEYLEGVTLKDLIRRKGALPLGVGLRIAKQICQGLEAAHAEGVVHRDIKPQNILIVPESGDIKITDFGIARVSAVGARSMTATGLILGTPDYISPEQAQGQVADLRSDIYSLGVVLFEVFSGRLPFSGDSAIALVLHHVQSPPPQLATVTPATPARLGKIVSRCLEKAPSDRYQDVSALYEDLSTLASA